MISNIAKGFIEKCVQKSVEVMSSSFTTVNSDRICNEHFGIPLLDRRQTLREITERVRCARVWCQRHWDVLVGSTIRLRRKFQLYAIFVRPILLYGCEVWKLDRRSSKKLLQFECSILCEIYKSVLPRRHPRRLRPNAKEVYSIFCDNNIIEHIYRTTISWNTLLYTEERALNQRKDRTAKRVHWWDDHRRRTGEEMPSG